MSNTWGDIQLECSRVPALKDVPLDAWPGFINQAYADILNTRDWIGLRQQINLGMAANVTAGSVAVVNGSASVTGTGTAWNPAWIDSRIQIAGESQSYLVSINSATELVLDRPYMGTTNAAAAYSMFRSRFTLPVEVKSVQQVIRPGVTAPLTRVSLAHILRMGPAYGEPMVWAPGLDDRPETAPINRTLEFWPWPNKDEYLIARYQIAPPGFNGDDLTASPLPWISLSALKARAKRNAAMDYAEAKVATYQEAYLEALDIMHREESQRVGAVQFDPSAAFTYWENRSRC